MINDGTNIIPSTFDGDFSEKANQMQIFDMLKPVWNRHFWVITLVFLRMVKLAQVLFLFDF